MVVAGVLRDIRYFVAPELPQTTTYSETEYLSLILGIPWLYSVDATISIRQSKIMIGDISVGEEVREVVGPELVFYKDHNLLMYPKSVMTITSKVVEIDDNDSDSSDSFKLEDELSDINNDPLVNQKQLF